MTIIHQETYTVNSPIGGSVAGIDKILYTFQPEFRYPFYDWAMLMRQSFYVGANLGKDDACPLLKVFAQNRLAAIYTYHTRIKMCLCQKDLQH